jgi:UDP-N-acetylglucosamine 1-carboxyvinyltransferase
MKNINIHGSKNSVLPIIASTLLEKNIYYLNNIPLISDVDVQLNILKQFNVKLNYINRNNLIIDTTELNIPNKLDYSKNTRGTYYFIGSSVSYNNNLEYILDTGCKIDERKIDYHIILLKMLGKNVNIIENKLLISGESENNDIIYTFEKPSVGATINAILMFCKCKSTIILNNYAKDPYIIDTIEFIKKIGINIEYNNEYIKINGIETNLISNTIIHHTIIDDPIEALTYIIYSGINLRDNEISSYTIGPLNIEHFGETYDLLENIGINLIEKENKRYYIKRNKLKSFEIKTGYYPEIYTDIQPFLCLLALFIENSICKIREEIWSDRFRYVDEIKKMGYNIDINGKDIIINTNNEKDIIINTNNEKDININENIYRSTDLRGGMAVLLLMRKNNIKEDPINKIYIDRGYSEYEKYIDVILKNDNGIYYNYLIKDLSNMKIGNISKYYVEVFSEKEIIDIVIYCSNNNIKYKLIGDGNNIYFTEYYDGMIIKNMYKDVIMNNDYYTVSSGYSLLDFVLNVSEHGYDISSMACIPGSIGGAIYGNAGAYEMELCNIVDECKIYSIKDLKTYYLKKEDMKFCYRCSILKENECGDIILSATIKINKSVIEKMDIKKKISEIIRRRNRRIPMENTLGSVFKNIYLENEKIYIWKMLDELKLRGSIINNIKINMEHPNIFINEDNICTSNDLNELIFYIKNLILKKYNLNIEKEIEFITT